MALADNLVGYWSPWLGSSGYRLLDRGGRANHGTLTNMDAGTDWVGASIRGRSGYVLDFDGVDDRVSATVPTVGVTSLSISAWVFFGSIPGAGSTAEIFGKWGNNAAFDSTDAFVLNVGNTQGLRFFIGGPNAGVTTGSAAVTTNIWYHIAAVWSQNTGRIFVDGVQQATGTITSSAMNSAASIETRIGRSTSSTGSDVALTGRVADVGLWLNRGLALAEVRELARIGPGWYRPMQPRRYGYVAAGGFKAYWARRQTQLIGGGL